MPGGVKRARRSDVAPSRLAAARDLLVIGIGVLGLFDLGLMFDVYDGFELFLIRAGYFDEVFSLGFLLLIGLAAFSLRRTAQVARERSLRRDTELQFRTVIEQVPATTYTSDATKPAGEADILYMSPQVEKLFGYPASDWLRDPELWRRCIHPDDREHVARSSDREDTSRETVRVEYRGLHKDGHVVWIHDESNIVSWDDRGNPLVAQGVMWDITARKETELSLRDAEERYRHLAEQSPVVPYLTARNTDGASASVSYIAPSVLDLSGYGPEEWMTRHELWDALIHPDDRERVREAVARTDRTGERLNVEYRLTRADGREIWVSDSAVLLETGGVRQGVIQDITQRKEAEHAVRQAEERSRRLVEQLPVVVYTDAADELSTAIYVSPRYEDLTGYTPEERLARPELWVEMLHPDDRDRVVAESLRTNETGEPFDAEYRIVSADGRTVWLHDYAILVEGPDGTPIWQGTLTDVSDRKLAEEAIGRRDRILEAAAFAAERFLNVPDWSDAIGGVLTRLGTSAGASRAYLYRNRDDPQDGLVMDLLEEWVAPGVVPSAEFGFNLRWPYAKGFQRWAETLGAGAAVHGLVRDHPEEERREAEAENTLSVCAVPVFVGGAWWGYIGLDQCDHERIWQQAEIESLRVVGNTLGAAINRQAAAAKLAQAEERFRVMVEHVPAAIYLDQPDRTMRSIYVSPQIEEITGITIEAWLADPRSWIDAIHPDDRDRILGAYVAAAEAHEAWAAEYRMVTPDGRSIWVNDETSMLRDADGNPLFLLGVIGDITERKLAEEALRASERREREAAERLRSLDEMKNTFLAAVSHELRSPLTSILGLALTLERATHMEAADRDDLLGRVAANARKLDRLLKDLLDIDRLSRGIVEPQYRSTDVGELAMRAAESLDVLAGRDVHVAAQPVHLAIDPPKVERIVENLLSNAARHTEADRRIWLRVEPLDAGVLIAVEDDGPGVPPELREEIFEPFQQGPSASSYAPGTGIGLSLVASFARLHDGRAWVEERDGGGASFRVFLPGALGSPDGHGDEGTVDASEAVSSRAS
jgi:PAS domain S-box-containing protein